MTANQGVGVGKREKNVCGQTSKSRILQTFVCMVKTVTAVCVDVFSL